MVALYIAIQEGRGTYASGGTSRSLKLANSKNRSLEVFRINDVC